MREDGALVVAHTWDGIPVDRGEQVRVRLRRDGAGGLEIEVEAPFWNDPPPPAAPGPCDRLWEFEAVEVFVAGGAEPGLPQSYTEFELSPHGHYLVLRFLGARNAVDRALVLDYQASITGVRWSGQARVAADLLPAEPWRANAFSLHGVGSARRFLAATPLPGPQPDFHQPERFPALP
jgi:hypothetical protein